VITLDSDQGPTGGWVVCGKVKILIYYSHLDTNNDFISVHTVIITNCSMQLDVGLHRHEVEDYLADLVGFACDSPLAACA